MARRFSTWGIRARTTAIAVLVVGAAVAVAMVALLYTARSSLIGQITDNAEARAHDVALLAEAGSIPDPIPGRGEELLVQVVDAGGRVLSSSASIDGQAPLVDMSLLPDDARTFTVPSLAEAVDQEAWGEGGADEGVPFLIAAVGARSSGQDVTVIVATSLNPISQLQDILTPLLAAGLPLIMLVVGLTVWLLTGRALRPVEAIRREAEEITATSLARRLPLPGTTDEIGRLAETMNRMLERLEVSAVAQRRFVSDASHELKSPIASIRTMLEVARREHPTDLERFLDDVLAEDARLERVVRDLLVLARADEGVPLTRMSDIDLDDIVLAEAAVAERVSGKRVDLTGVGAARVRGDSGALASLVRNLLDNAARYATSAVWITLEARDSSAVLTVSDDGPGIPEAERERVFERFVRLDESRQRASGGTGLGLAVCRAIARSLDGDVRAVDPTHAGASFEVRLPIG